MHYIQSFIKWLRRIVLYGNVNLARQSRRKSKQEQKEARQEEVKFTGFNRILQPSQPKKSCLRKPRFAPYSSDGTSQSDFSEDVSPSTPNPYLEQDEKVKIEELDEKIETVRSKWNRSRRTINLRERHINLHNMFHMSNGATSLSMDPHSNFASSDISMFVERIIFT